MWWDLSFKIARQFLDPIAHRKAKIVYNFGLSECNKVKTSQSKTKAHRMHRLKIFEAVTVLFSVIK